MTSRAFQIRRCALAGVEAVAAATSHRFPRHTHDQFGIGVIHQGAQKSLSGRGQVEAGAGDIITVNPGEVHDGMPIGDHGRSWRMLYLAPSLVARIAVDLSDGQSADYEFANPVIREPVLARQFAALYASMTAAADRHTVLQQEERLLHLLASLRDERVRQEKAYRASTTTSAAPAAIRRAKALIDDDPVAALTLHHLARESGLSRFQVVRGFTRATGLTPHAYLMQRRIDLARQLIAGGRPLASVAAESGFADQSHMTRLFSRTYGISPGAYAALHH